MDHRGKNNSINIDLKSTIELDCYISNLCRKLVSKTKCQKLRQDKDGNLYKVKTYHYDKLSKLERTKRKEQKESKRLQDLPNIELSKIVNHMFNSNWMKYLLPSSGNTSFLYRNCSNNNQKIKE